MEDTGFDYAYNDAIKAEQLLNEEFVEYILHLPYVCMITRNELNDPNWEPPFEQGLIIYNMCYHGDESTPHIHMPYIPYVRNQTKGQSIQNAFTKAFAGMGYTTQMQQAVDKEGNLVWQTDKDGNTVPQMKRTTFGAVEWTEEIKEVLHNMMKSKYGWDRLYKGSNPRGNLLLSDYRREKAAERAKTAEITALNHERDVSGLKNTKKQLKEDIKKKEEKKIELLAENLADEYVLKIIEDKISNRNAELSQVNEEIANKMIESTNYDITIENQQRESDRLDEAIDNKYKEEYGLMNSIADKKVELSDIVAKIVEMNDELERRTDLTEQEKLRHKLVLAKVLDCANSIDFYNKEIERLSAEYEVWKARRKEQEDKVNVTIMRGNIAEKLYKEFVGVDDGSREFELKEKIIKVTYENECLKRENADLRSKLDKAYEYMKQFTVRGVNMLEDFLGKVRERVREVLVR